MDVFLRNFSSTARLVMDEGMIHRLVLFALLACSISLRPVQAQEISPAPATAPNVLAARTFDPAEATKAWLKTVPAEKRAKSDAYFEGGYWLLLWNFLLTAAISIFLLASKFSAQLRDFTERVTGSKTLQVALYAIGYILVVAILSFTLTFYHFFV